jgi:L-alanine-DL-glutamate epimerase-like enolase superfamily enzyme
MLRKRVVVRLDLNNGVVGYGETMGKQKEMRDMIGAHVCHTSVSGDFRLFTVNRGQYNMKDALKANRCVFVPIDLYICGI